MGGFNLANLAQAAKQLFNPPPQNPLYGPPQAADPSQAPPSPAPAQQPAAPDASAQPAVSAPAPAPASLPPGSAPIPAAPQPYTHGKLANAFLTLGQIVGNPYATAIGQRDRARTQEIQEYERNKPVAQYGAQVQAGRLANEFQKAPAELAQTQAQTAEAQASTKRSTYEMGREQDTAKANAIQQIMGEVESGKYGDGQALQGRWQRIAAANPHLGLTAEDIQNAIAGTHPLGAKYQVMKGENGRPEGLQDREGNQYTPEQIAKDLAGDKEAQTLWQSAQQGHQQARTEKRQDESAVAGYAAESQARAFANTQTEAGRKLAATHMDELSSAKNQLELINKLASSKSPTDQTSLAFKALGLDLPEGVHRINETELNAIRQQGNLSDRAYGALLKWTKGQSFAPDILNDIRQTANTIAQSKMKTANDQLENVNRIYGYKAKGSDDAGRFDSQQGGQGGAKVATRQHLADYAKQKGVTPQQAEKEFKDAGYTIQ